MSAGAVFDAVFEAMLAADSAMQKAVRLRDLRTELAVIGTRCGHCSKWMKSRECPKEHNVNGMSRGPSCESLKCSEYVESNFAIQFREKKAAEIAELSGASA